MLRSFRFIMHIVPVPLGSFASLRKRIWAPSGQNLGDDKYLSERWITVGAEPSSFMMLIARAYSPDRKTIFVPSGEKAGFEPSLSQWGFEPSELIDQIWSERTL